MKRLEFLLFIFTLNFLIPILCLSQNKTYKNGDDYMKFYIGPETGGTGYYVFKDTGGGKFYWEYSLGARMVIRPVRLLALETGFRYRKIIHEFHYYSLPLFLHYYINRNIYNIKDMAIIVGPEFNFVPKENKMDYKKPLVGIAVGIKHKNFESILCYFLKHPINLIDNQKNNSFVGLGLYISWGIGF